MKLKIYPTAVLASCFITLSACGGGAQTGQAVEAEVIETVEGQQANGTVIEVEMITRDPETGRQIFRPGLLRAKVGDTVVFKPTNPTHQSQSIDQMIPDGVTGWMGGVNEEVAYIIPAPGIYGYKCNPHYAAGMIGLIVVEGDGMSDNLEIAKSVTHPGLAGKAFEELFAAAEL